MSFEQFAMMRQELFLIVVSLLLLIAELSYSAAKKHKVINLSLILMGLVTIAGFFPTPTGTLFGGMYQSSSLTQLMKGILNIGTFVVLLQSAKYLKKDEMKDKLSEFILLLIFTLIGMSFMISSGDFLMFYIGLELATLPLAALAAFEKYKEKSAEAGIKYILISALSSGILLWGLSMIYGTTGSLYFKEVAANYSNAPLQALAFIFFFAGMAFKISLVPFHLWTADVYEGAPINVTSYLSVISKGAAAFIFVIILYTVFSPIVLMWKDIIYVIAILTMTIGNLFAIRQKNLKRFMAFSSISQAGFILLGIIGGSVLGMTTVIYFILVYIFSNLGVFGVISAVSNATGKENIDDYDGMYRTNPKLCWVMTLSLFSLAGIPPLAGFFGKFFLFSAAAQQGLYILVFIAVLNTIISLYYYLLIIKAMFINHSVSPIAWFKNDFITRLGLLICVAGIVIIGFSGQVFDYIQSISEFWYSISIF
ncbi:MAG TPA: NADH-quinone oxidoreductase subunit N [Bacteroidales bacterium]|nr:NADH-quinone oxidoreductase subunit N [Bacteroidales bacterium]